MRNDEVLKKQHELSVGERFIRLHNLETRLNFKLKEQREKPDLIYEDELRGKIIGLEIAAAYYGDRPEPKILRKNEPPFQTSHAEFIWGSARRNETADEFQISEPDEKFFDSVNARIQQKCRKIYQFSYPLYLVIDNECELTTEETVETFVAVSLRLPKRISFHRIWLLSQTSFSSSTSREMSQQEILAFEATFGNASLNLPGQTPRDSRYQLFPKMN